MLMRAIEWSGDTIWKRMHLSGSKAGPCGTACSSAYGTGFDDAGDLQGDGLIDSWVWHSIEHDSQPEAVHKYVVDAGTGGRSFVSGNELHAPGASFDRGGDDVVFLRPDREGIAARTATWTGRTLWDTTFAVPLGSGNVELQATAARLDGDRCADLLVGIGGRRGQYVAVLDGGDGSVLWAQTLEGDGPAPRTIATRDSNRVC